MRKLQILKMPNHWQRVSYNISSELRTSLFLWEVKYNQNNTINVSNFTIYIKRSFGKYENITRRDFIQ